MYHIDRFNPRSSYHLSLGLNYPNDADRHFADPEHPGSDIFIHGRASSIGCLAIGDEAIEELYVLASDVTGRTRRKIPVHIFPARMDTQDWSPTTTEPADLPAFWENLRPIYTQFEHTRHIPKVSVDDTGRYQLQ